MKRLIFLVLAYSISVTSCDRKEVLCPTLENFGFTINEKVGAYFIPSDSVYEKATILFKTNESFKNTVWKIGSGQRQYSGDEVQLFFPSPDDIAINLRATTVSSCNIMGKTASAQLHILSSELKSPLKGNYIGTNEDSPGTVFSVSIKFWRGERYSWWPEGAFSVHNLPEGYKDSSQNFNGMRRPEIDGIVCSNSYKTISFNKGGNISAQGLKGYGFLSNNNDSIIIRYEVLDTTKLNQSSTIKYISKTFRGKRVN
jgi:hypothetical protein